MRLSKAPLPLMCLLRQRRRYVLTSAFSFSLIHSTLLVVCFCSFAIYIFILFLFLFILSCLFTNCISVQYCYACHVVDEFPERDGKEWNLFSVIDDNSLVLITITTACSSLCIFEIQN
ncbi:uncharacterized protein DS421_3g90450 [Arachis hypogaea]|nr:uncharacterized protein DS421_3g90450 [Arachis hypogaea]